jgi:hypothetical protein
VLKGVYLVCYILFFLFYLFIIGCAFTAVGHLKANKYFKFDIPAFILLTVFNFILFVIPQIFDHDNILTNAKFIPSYLICACNKVSLFLIYSIFNITITDNTKRPDNNQIKKAYFLIIFLSTNIVISLFIFFLEERETRIRSIRSLATFGTILFFCKTVIVVINIIKCKFESNNINHNLDIVKKLISKYYNGVNEQLDYPAIPTPKHLEKLVDQVIFKNEENYHIPIDNEESNLQQKQRIKRKSQNQQVDNEEIIIEVKDPNINI